MIEVQNLVKWYGSTLAVDHLNFTIPHGQIVGFLGPNGAGKSTTLRILTGYLPATTGRVSIDGHDVFNQSLAVRSKIGYLPENTPLYPEMRVEEYLHYRGQLQEMDRSTRLKRIDIVCDRCGLTAVRRRLIGQLSRGNRQRVGLAQALLHDPPVLVLDEPTAGLDPNQITHVRKLIAELRNQHTIILSTHILPEVEKNRRPRHGHRRRTNRGTGLTRRATPKCRIRLSNPRRSQSRTQRRFKRTCPRRQRSPSRNLGPRGLVPRHGHPQRWIRHPRSIRGRNPRKSLAH